jgi:pSer/pThr/pTyr-binding forkhead associated (FHA) protein
MSEHDECPFVGLPPFSKEYERYFFGRAHDSAVIVDNLLARPLTVLYGASGTGKSSVLNAGIPAVLRHELEEFSLVSRKDWHDPSELTNWLHGRVDAATREHPLVLIFDQFEEYFLYRTAETGDAFESALAGVLGRSDLEVHLLLSLRSDALHVLDGLRLQFYTIMDNTIELKHLDERGVREAIEGPIRVYNESRAESEQVVLGDGFTDYFVNELLGSLAALAPQRASTSGAAQVELPFLQLALLRLWNKRSQHSGTKSREITRDLLVAEGGVDGVVGTHVREKLDGDLSHNERRLASQIFHYLVTPSGGKFAYSPQDLADSASESAGERIDSGEVERLLGKLAEGDARILRRVGDRFELFHDVLARPILNWRADFRKSTYLDEAPFGYLVDIFSDTQISLRGSGLLIGRYAVSDEDATPLALAPVSRTHLLIMRDGQILDLRSRFGTTVNAKPVHFGQTDAYLRDGDIVGLGNTAAVMYRTATAEQGERRSSLPAQQLTPRRSWGLLIDGSSRRVFWLTGPTVDLGVEETGIVAGGQNEVRDPFARLTVDKENGRDKVWLTALAESLNVIERTDSYEDRAWSLDINERFEVDLNGIPHPNPETMSDLEGAYRGLFQISDKRFEIILNHPRDEIIKQ